MKKSLLIAVTAVSALSLAVFAATKGGGGRPAPAARPSSGPRNSGSNRPQVSVHPTITRPVEVRPTGGHNGGQNGNGGVNIVHQGGNIHPDNGRPGPDLRQGERPVHVDNRNPRAIRGDVSVLHVRPGYIGHEDWRPAGWVGPRWDHFYPGAGVAWFVYPVGYSWVNVQAVTCQAEFTLANSPNDGDIYTSDSTVSTWGNAWGTETVVSSDTLGEALDQCAAINGVDPNNPATGACVPVENPEDSDGCFVSYDVSRSH